ncbi:MAG: 50S ribosomal protein L6 [Ottowia sp.]|nr:50S ribosomal protein L6 [Ottowia sp.]
MSRIGKAEILLPNGVDVVVSDGMVVAKGPLGTLSLALHKLVTVVRQGDALVFSAVDSSREANAMHGTVRALVSNMVKGVAVGFQKKLNLIGVGYRAQVKGKLLKLQLGFSHDIEYEMPKGVSAETPTQTEILIKGIDNQAVGQVAAEIRAYRQPEPYKGKGVRYSDEVVLLKETKKK